MKTNTMMRVASVLLVAVLLSTCAIAGTYAKYVTSASGTDTARVAKWGIRMDNTGKSTFVAQYDSTNPTVKGLNGSTEADVVAPGTNSSATYKVTGTPETDYVVTFEGKDITDVYLKAGAYTYTTNASGNDASYTTPVTTTVNSDYYPITYTITISSAIGEIGNVENASSTIIADAQKTTDESTQKITYKATYTKLSDALADLAKVKVTYSNNEMCDLEVVLSWEWKFNNENDLNDTILGDLAAGSIVSGTNDSYSLNIKYTLTLTATQID